MKPRSLSFLLSLLLCASFACAQRIHKAEQGLDSTRIELKERIDQAKQRFDSNRIDPKGSFLVTAGAGIFDGTDFIRFWGGRSYGWRYQPSRLITYYAGASYFVGNSIALGLNFAAEPLEGKLYSGQANHGAISGQQIGTYRSGIYTAAASFSLFFLKQRYVMFYGSLEGGYSYETVHCNFDQPYYNYSSTAPVTQESSGHYNLQVSPCCFRFGGLVAALVELGFGYKGLLNLGLSCRF